jgi:ABC-type bacteriocin/lantibiotic exporter with double-glycine peptidase domain
MISLLGLTLPLVIMQVFDRVIPNKAIETLWWLIIGGIVAVVFESILKYTRVNTSTEISDNFEYKTGKQLFHQILENSQVQKRQPGQLIDAFNSVSHLRNFYSGELYQSLLDLPFALLFIVIILNISLSIGLFLLVVVTVYFLIVKYYMGPLILKMQETENEVEQKNISFLLATFSNILKIKTNHCEEKQLRRSETVQTQISEAAFYSGNLGALKNLVSELGGQIIFFGVIAIGAYLATTGNLTVGQLTACSFIARRVFGPIQSFSQMLISIEKFNASKNKIDDILYAGKTTGENSPKKVNISPAHLDGTINLMSVSYFNKENPVFENLSIQFPAKKLTFIECEHPNQSTLLAKIITGFEEPNQGQVNIDGIPYAKFDPANLNNIISYIPPEGTFIEGTVIDNITLFNPSKNSLAQDCVGMLGRTGLISDLPSGFDTKIDSRNITFYPGLKETMTLARELIKRPRALIIDRIDEPMDQSDFNSLVWLLKLIKSKTTIVIISKNQYFKKICDIHLSLENYSLHRKESR